MGASRDQRSRAPREPAVIPAVGESSRVARSPPLIPGMERDSRAAGGRERRSRVPWEGGSGGVAGKAKSRLPPRAGEVQASEEPRAGGSPRAGERGLTSVRAGAGASAVASVTSEGAKASGG